MIVKPNPARDIFERALEALNISYIYLSYLYFIFDLFKEGCPSTEVVFQGALQ